MKRENEDLKRENKESGGSQKYSESKSSFAGANYPLELSNGANGLSNSLNSMQENHFKSVPGNPMKKLKLSSAQEYPDFTEVQEEDDLARFQKKAIYLQMCEYKRLYTSLADDHSALLKREDDVNNFLSKFLSIWGLIESSLSCTKSQLNKNLANPELPTLLEKSWENVKGALGGVSGAHVPPNASELRNLSDLEQRLVKESAEKAYLKEKLEQKSNELKVALKKVDRLRIMKKPQITEPIKQEEVSEKKSEKMVSSVDQEQLLEIQLIAEARSSQIDMLSKEKYTLQRQLDEKIIELSHERAGRETEKTLRHQLDQQERLKHDLEKALSEIENLQAGRRAFVEQISNEEEKRRKAIEADIKKCEQDLIRLRTHRDNLQKAVDLHLAKESQEKVQLEEIRKLSETRKIRIETLEMEVKRLKIEISAEAGESGLLRFFSGPEGDQNPFNSTASKVKELESNIIQLELINRSLQEQDQSKIASDLKVHIEKISYLEKELQNHKTVFGTIGSESDLAKQVIIREQDLQNLKTKYEGLEMSEKIIKDEFEALGAAWVKLEEQVSSKVFNLSEKEDQIAKLISEKSRLEQKIISLNKQVTTCTNNQIAQKRQSEKLLEQIRKLEEIEKTLSQQMQTCEQKNASISPALFQGQQKLDAQLLANAEIRDQVKSVSAKCESMAQLLNEKSEQMEIEKELARKTLEQSVTIKKKYDAFVKDNGDALQRQQLEQYRLLLMCQSCNNDFKSHVLLKCMHTFCKGCIDDRLDSRQRKCPTCAIPFGQQDVKQVYL